MRTGRGMQSSSAPNAKPVLMASAIGSGLLAVGASLWWSYGGESDRVAVVSYGSVVLAGVFAFAGGLRGEFRLGRSPLATAIVGAGAAFAATFVGIAIANFRTDGGSSSGVKEGS